MGNEDAITKEYLRNNEVFADVFNYQLFDGEPVIRPENLIEMDPAETFFLPAVPEWEKPEKGAGDGDKSTEPDHAKAAGKKKQGGSDLTKSQFRDLFKNTIIRRDSEAVYRIRLGLESQTNVHYAMPVRNQLYDAAEYFRQTEKIMQRHKSRQDHGGHTGAEYISHFYREDRLIPVFTLTIYFGSEPWDGPLSLHEMLDTKDPEILKFIPDYRIHLIEPSCLKEEELLKFRSSFREVMGYIKYSKDAAALLAYTKDNPRMIMDISAARVIEAMTKTTLPRAEEKEGKINMCKAIDDIKEQAKAEGKTSGLAEGRAAGLAEGRASGFAEGRSSGLAEGETKTLKELVKKGMLTVKNAAEYAGMSVEEFQKMCI